LEEVSESRSEYIDGQISPMSGGSPEHHRLIGNIYKCLDNIADEREEMTVFFTDMRLWIPLSSIDCNLPVTTIYRKIRLPQRS
jgi:Putative restriction endonuclease